MEKNDLRAATDLCHSNPEADLIPVSTRGRWREMVQP